MSQGCPADHGGHRMRGGAHLAPRPRVIKQRPDASVAQPPHPSGGRAALPLRRTPLGGGGAPCVGEGAQGAGVADGLGLADTGLDTEGGEAGAVAEVEEDPGVTGAQIDVQDLRPGRSRRLDVRLTTVTPSSSAMTLGRLSSASTPKKTAAVKMNETRSPGVRVSSIRETTVRTTNMAVPTLSSTTLVRVGLKVTGRAGCSGAVMFRASFVLVRDGRRGWPW